MYLRRVLRVRASGKTITLRTDEGERRLTGTKPGAPIGLCDGGGTDGVADAPPNRITLRGGGELSSKRSRPVFSRRIIIEKASGVMVPGCPTYNACIHTHYRSV